MALTVTKLSPNLTKTRILDAAEGLFVAIGFDAMSMRQITAAAGVNLAAVNYHFGSKEALIQVVLARRLDPLNQARMAMLDQFESKMGAKVTCEHLLTALFLPAIRMSNEPNMCGHFLQFVGRSYSDVSSVVNDFIRQRYANTLGRFFLAFQRALPELCRDDLGFRLYFAMTALSGVLAAGNTQKLIREFTQGQSSENLLLMRLSSLLVGALRAPLPNAENMTFFEETFGLFKINDQQAAASLASA